MYPSHRLKPHLFVAAQVYQLLTHYQQALHTVGYDKPDLLASIFRGLSKDGYRGMPITHIFRDELQ